MTEFLSELEEDKVYELNIGKSFQNVTKTSYHQFKYDFTPASIDKNQVATVSIGTKNDVVIQVPHIDGSAQKYTQFTGNKQPCTTKECVLIYDKRTNEFTLERLQTNFILKRSRLEGSSKAQIITPRSITPTNENNSKKKKLDQNQSQSTPATTTSSSVSTVPITAASQVDARKKIFNKETGNKLFKEPSPPPKSSLTKNENFFGFENDLNLSDDDSDLNDSNIEMNK